MYVLTPYFVFMEAVASYMIHSGKTSHFSQFQCCCLVGKGEDGPSGATLMLNPMMPLCGVSFLCDFAMHHMDVFDVILSLMTPVNQCHFLHVLNGGCVHMVPYVCSLIVHGT